MSDKPCECCGRYDNTATVVAVVVLYAGSILLVQRNTEPGKGKIALPGGFHMKGEKWQEAGAREVLEETSIVLLNPTSMNVLDITTDEYGHNVLIAHYTGGEVEFVDSPTDGEVIPFWSSINASIPPEDWAFLLHYRAVRDHLGW